jgi:hypothetical protein
MPDALSKTVPIWCAVVNKLLFPELPAAHQLHTPPKCISPSEQSQIEARLDDFAKQIEVRTLSTDFDSILLTYVLTEPHTGRSNTTEKIIKTDASNLGDTRINNL